jgi:hypothetical protein
MVCMSQTFFCTAFGTKPAWRQASVTCPYRPGIRRAEKYGHGGMADDLRAALVGLGE